MSSNYYDMRDGKVRIAHELMNRGWTVHGYKEDESDSMTDYYSPANWDGIAEKNGFVLCVDVSCSAEKREIKKYNYSGCLSYEDKEKIAKLEAMTQERGATAGEEENAKALIEKIKANTSDSPTYEVIGYLPAHQANPGKSKWHIEKDGTIYDKGTGITKYSDMPEEYMFDINKMEYKNEYKKVWEYNDEEGQRVYTNRKLSDDTKKLITEFKSLILKWERIVNNMNTMGDGTKETEQAAEQQMKDDKLEKVIEKVTKKVIKPILVTDRKSILTGDVLTFNYHGGYWLVTEVYSNNKDKTCISYENLGSASRGYQQLKSPQRYYDMEERILKGIEKGTIKIYTLQEVEEVTEVEKWIRKKPANNKTEQKPENKPDEKGEKPISNNSETITEQASKRQLWALHCATKLNTTNLIISREKASELIDRSMKGENITDIIKEMLNNKAA